MLSRTNRAINSVVVSKKERYFVLQSWIADGEILRKIYARDPFVFALGISKLSLKDKYEACCAVRDIKLVERLSPAWHLYCSLGNRDEKLRVNEKSFIYPLIKSGDVNLLKAAISKATRLDLELDQEHIFACTFDIAVFLLIESQQYFTPRSHRENIYRAIKYCKNNGEIVLLTMLESYKEQKMLD